MRVSADAFAGITPALFGTGTPPATPQTSARRGRRALTKMNPKIRYGGGLVENLVQSQSSTVFLNYQKDIEKLKSSGFVEELPGIFIKRECGKDGKIVQEIYVCP